MRLALRTIMKRPAITTGSPVGIARSRSGYSQTQPLESEVGVFEAGPGVEDLVHARADPLQHLVILLQQRPEARTSALHGFHRGPLDDEVGVISRHSTLDER